jgi:hypothetical protein
MILRQGLQAVPRTPEDPVTAPLHFELAAAQKIKNIRLA